MVKTKQQPKEKILSAVSIWKTYDCSAPLDAVLLQEKTYLTGMTVSHVSFNGRVADDGRVRVYAKYARPVSATGKCPTVLLLPDAGKELDEELLTYFVEKGYAVLMPDYCGETEKVEPAQEIVQEPSPEGEQLAMSLEIEEEATAEVVAQEDETPMTHTVYPPSLAYANYAVAQGFEGLEGLSADKTCWYEWTYVALYAIEYLKSLGATDIGVVGIRVGGEIAWKVMLSPDVKCGVPINAAGWRSYKDVKKFDDAAQMYLSDERHRYIAGIESQSYAPFVKCPVLMLCALNDYSFDYDRAYDTFTRINSEKTSGIFYSHDTGSCIGGEALTDMDMFLQKRLKGREIYLPKPLNVSLDVKDGAWTVSVESDPDGLLDVLEVYAAETDGKTRSVYREWQRVYSAKGKKVKDGKVSCPLTVFEGTSSVCVYAYARYLNGFAVVSKVVSRKNPDVKKKAVKTRMIFSGEDIGCFCVADHTQYSVGGIFLDKEAFPCMQQGADGLYGASCVGGLKTYKISSPKYRPDDNALLEFELYSCRDDKVRVSIDVSKEDLHERFSCICSVKGGGKWKRIVLTSAEFKGEESGASLERFSDGWALLFDCESEENDIMVTNILWL
ncbi:MAG: hypothetical protein IKC37_01040 [Clostridia bacterium]|nr:hypothetical protein [Clostridia bacterium]